MVEPGSQSRLGALLERPRFEVIPLKNVHAAVGHLPDQATVTVTASPSKGMGPTVDLAVELARSGFDVIPHISAKLTGSRAELESILERTAEAAITEAFVVGGDGEARGPFADGLALLEAMESVGHGFERIGVPGYPEGHPTIPGDVLDRALDDKAPYASAVTTQLCFDAATLGDWITGQRAAGMELPLYIGIAGVGEVRKLVAIAARIGVGDSRRFLSATSGLLGRLVRPGGYAPDGLLTALADLPEEPLSEVSGFHIYTFNQIETTERWRREFRAAVG